MSAFVLIPARSGSTRVKDKNIRLLNGKPLVAHAIESALRANVGRVIVSTNDQEIASIAKSYGAEIPFMRPEHLATAEASSFSFIAHCLNWLRENEQAIPEYLILRPPTNPLIKADTISEMLAKIKLLPQFHSIVTISEAITHPYEICSYNSDGKLTVGILEFAGKTVYDFERSQDRPVAYVSSPGCRLTRTKWFLAMMEANAENVKTYDTESTTYHKIPQLESIDIDNEMDFLLADKIAEILNQKESDIEN